MSDVDVCAHCGFRYDLYAAEDAGRTIETEAAALASVLTRGGDSVRRRPEPQTWSPLEYCCHVRDVLLVQRERVLAMRRDEVQSLPTMGRDERVEHDGYADQQPADVARQLGDAALLFANVLNRLEPVDWERTVTYNFPVRTERSLRWVAVHTLHEVAHHRHDINPRDPSPPGT